ncbi:hypothetical protein crov498 [Cafeteria roenbergensis virus]|uniref:Uncharacterized protein n=1 Tax=Cafeteria roenbergensis virus (strain BV-PW1) TaxID=693272 RepID=E3T5R9_CROVB|nr:hypothetical protein crov498 [Cafeteria roenbergensis virus BV-PW1]ADO67532.1 hypothetical protein crov498 [Cafeteria roenbergensis virus BV-PW1]
MINYNDKYLKYKNKYLELKKNLEFLNSQKGGEFVPYDMDQKTWHEILNYMDEKFVLVGSTCIFQWHNENTVKNSPQTVTLFGEAHFNYDVLSRIKGTPLSQNGKPFTDVDPKKHTQFLVVELLWYLFKGTRRCIDFYLEDWRLEGRKKSFDMSWDKDTLNWNLTSMVYRVGDGFTIKNLIYMLDNDMHTFIKSKEHPEYKTRKDVKKFKNIRAHYNEFRVPHCDYNILLPYSIDNHWGVTENRYVIDRIIHHPGKSFMRGGPGKGFPSITKFLIKFGNLYKLIAGVNHDETNIFKYIQKDNLPRNDFTTARYELYTDFNVIYDDIFEEYTKFGFNSTTSREELNKKTILEKKHIYYPVLEKNLKNLWDCDSITQHKYITFFNTLFDFKNIIPEMEKHYEDLSVGFKYHTIEVLFINYILNFIMSAHIWIIDIYNISRNIKRFSLKDQSKNLDSSSMCFNNANLADRNIVCYSGANHTINYYFFYYYFFESAPTYSIDGHFGYINTMFSTYTKLNDTGINTLYNKPLNKNNLKEYCRQYWLYCILISSSKIKEIYTPIYTNIFTSEDTNNINHQIIKNASIAIQVSPYLFNKFNIIKKILINITKENNKRTTLIQNLDYLIMNKSFNDNDLYKNYKYYTPLMNLKDLNMYIKEGFDVLTLDLFNKNILKGIKVNNNYYSSNSFYGKTIDQSELKNIKDYVSPEYDSDKIIINNVLTNIIDKIFLFSYKDKIIFLKNIITFLETAFKQWQFNRYEYYTDDIYSRDNHPSEFVYVRKAVYVSEDKIKKSLEQNIRLVPIIKLIFKGEVPLKLLFNKLVSNFNIQGEETLHSIFNNIHTNMFEFEIKIIFPSPNEKDISEDLKITRTYKLKELFTELSLFNSMVIRDLVNIFNNDKFSKKLFSIFEMDHIVRESKLNKYLDKLNKLIPNFKEFKNIKQFDNLIVNNDISVPSNTVYKLDKQYHIYKQVNSLYLDDYITTDKEYMHTNEIFDNSKSGVAIIETEIPLEDRYKINILSNINKSVDVYGGGIDSPLYKIMKNISVDKKIKAQHYYELEDFYKNFNEKLVNKLYIEDRLYLNNIYNNGGFYQVFNPLINNIKGSYSLNELKYNFNLIGHYTTREGDGAAAASAAGAAGAAAASGAGAAAGDDTVVDGVGDSDTFVMQSGGNLINLSIYDELHPRFYLNLETKDYKIDMGDQSYDYLNYTSYSLNGHIMDLISKLFIENTNSSDLESLNKINEEVIKITPETIFITPPWRDINYAKLVQNLVILLFIEKIQQVDTNIHEIKNINKISKLFKQLLKCFDISIPIKTTPAKRLTQLKEFKNKLVEFFDSTLFIPKNKKINARVDDVPNIRPSIKNHKDALKYEYKQLLETEVDEDCPTASDSMLNKINHFSKLNGLIVFVYLNIRFINYHIYNIEKNGDESIFEVEDDENLKLNEYLKNIYVSLHNSLQIIDTIQKDNFSDIIYTASRNLE